MKVVFLADNRNRDNWGCRATSTALKDMVREHADIIYTIDGTFTHVYRPLHLRDRIYSLSDRIRMALYRRGLFTQKIKDNDPYNIIKETVADSYIAYRRMINNKPLSYYQKIDEMLRQCDALVCNGEGTAIFTNPPRYDSIFYALIFKLAQEYGKKTYYLNAVFSDCPETGRNTKTLNEFKDIFLQCTKVTARDPLSYQYYLENIGNNAIYVPDALFSWTKYSDYLPLAKTTPRVIVPFPEYDEVIEKYDFRKPYVCLSGSSFAAWTQQEACNSYIKLALALKEHYNVYIVPTCIGDRFLERVANVSGCPLIPVHTNIYFGMSILASADIFISGRWHPSILASIGGTPCVFLSSNSHKTTALQHMLNYAEIKEYNAIPTDEDVSNILKDCQNILSSPNYMQLRNKIRSTSESLSKDSLLQFMTTDVS